MFKVILADRATGIVLNSGGEWNTSKNKSIYFTFDLFANAEEFILKHLENFSSFQVEATILDADHKLVKQYVGKLPVSNSK